MARTFFNEVNYAQHEAWFIRELVDAIRGGSDHLMPDLQLLCWHYLDDHTDDNGGIWNQNRPEETPVDYSTVDCPMVHLIEAGKLLSERGDKLGPELLAFCHKQASHLFNRGFSFPTEGEPCTEDGSIACQAWGLARAYNELANPDAAWVELAEELMAYHAKHELSGSDIRLDGSTIRFWETQYESDDWGPSINAGTVGPCGAPSHAELYRAATSNIYGKPGDPAAWHQSPTRWSDAPLLHAGSDSQSTPRR